MARRTHEELVEALGVFDMSIEAPPSNEELNRRWKELLSKVHSDRPGGSEFLSKQLNAARDVIKEWLDAGKPQWQGKKESAADQARERARRDREAEAARDREKSEREDAAESGGTAGAADEDREQAREYAQENWEKHFHPAAAGGDLGFYDRRRRRRGLIKLWLKRGSLAALIGGLYIGISSDWGKHWPYIGEQPQQLIVCWDKIVLPYDFAYQKANEEVASRRLWHGIWWGGHPVIRVEGTKWVRPKKQVIIQTSLEFFSSRKEMFYKADCYQSWRKIQVLGIDEIRRKLGK